MKKVLLIVPAYNEEKNIEKTISDIKRNCNYDYVIVNDCSKDDTELVCKKNKFNYINLPINYGLTSGFQVGVKYAYKNGYDVVIQFDGDGQHQAKYLEKIVKELGNNNVVIGSRFVSKKKPFSLRMIGSFFIKWAIFFTTFKKVNDPTSGMRAYDKECIKEFIINDSLTPEPDTLVYLMKKGKKVKEVQVEMSEREYGTSYLNLFRSFEYMTNVLFSIFFVRFLTRGRK